MNAAQLTVSTQENERGFLVTAVGEVDLTTVLQLRKPVLEAVEGSQKAPVIVDLCRVDFIDSAGLALLVEARKRLAPEARPLHILLTPGRQPERVLRLGRFDTIMNLAYDIDEIPLPAEQAH